MSRNGLKSNLKHESFTFRITLDIFGKAIFGVDFCTLINEKDLFHQYHNVVKWFTRPYIFVFPKLSKMTFIPFVKECLNDISTFDRYIYDIIDAKKKSPPEDEKRADLLDLMIAASLKEENGLSDFELRVTKALSFFSFT
jgi:cytochrome P450